jgi:hypothetical protein
MPGLDQGSIRAGLPAARMGTRDRRRARDKALGLIAQGLVRDGIEVQV